MIQVPVNPNPSEKGMIFPTWTLALRMKMSATGATAGWSWAVYKITG